MSSLIDNAITRAQFNLRGGWKSALLFGGSAGVAIVALILLTSQTAGRGPAAVLPGWVTGLLVAQAVVLVLLGASQVGTAIKKDLTSGLIESHRLMPVRPVHAAFGYIAGATGVLMAVAAAIFACGLVTASIAGLPVSYWPVANLVLLGFAVFWWTLMAFSAFATRGTGLLIGLVIASVWLSGGQVLHVLPPVAVLVSPLIGPTIFDARVAEQVTWAYGASAVAQAVLAAIFLVGAGRRYRSDVQAVLGVKWALLLLLAWTAVTMIGLQFRDAFGPTWLRVPRGSDLGLGVVMTVSLSTMLLAVTIPITAAARASRDAFVARSLGEPDGPRGVPTLVVLLASVAVAAGVLLLPVAWAASEHDTARIGTVAVLFGVAGLSLGLARLGSAISGRGGVFIVASLLLVGFVPVLADVLRHASSTDSHEVLTVLSDFSPFAALVRLWNPVGDGPPALPAGPLAWIALGLVAGWFATRVQRTQQRELEALAGGFAAPAAPR